MTKNKLKGLASLASIISVIGIILIFFSVNFGTSLAEKWLAKQGGADTSTYLIVLEGYINNFIVSGSIVFGIGLAAIAFAYYKILNIIE